MSETKKVSIKRKGKKAEECDCRVSGDCIIYTTADKEDHILLKAPGFVMDEKRKIRPHAEVKFERLYDRFPDLRPAD